MTSSSLFAFLRDLLDASLTLSRDARQVRSTAVCPRCGVVLKAPNETEVGIELSRHMVFTHEVA